MPSRDLIAGYTPPRIPYGTVDGEPITSAIRFGGIWLVFTATCTHTSLFAPLPATHYTSDRCESWLREVLS